MNESRWIRRQLRDGVTRFVAIAALLAAGAGAQELKVEPGFGTGWIPPTQPLELKISRGPTDAEGRLAVFIDQTDVTALVRTGTTRMTYGPNAMPLPSGQHEIVVSLVAPDGSWRELGRFPIKVLTRRGFESSKVKRSLDMSNKGQVGYHEVPASSFGQRNYFQDLTLQGGLSTELRRGGFALRTQTNLAGASYIHEALRYGELGTRAPRVDLSSYKIEWQQGPALLSVGHVSFGSQRHLINGFGGRGGLFSLQLGRIVSVQIAGLSGTAIVGWDNILGVSNREHRMLATTLGIEMLPSRPGGARIEASILDGSLRPLNNFNQGAIRAAEKSRGHALRFLGSTPAQRWIVDAGYTRSRFRPARDDQLEEGVDVVPLKQDERDAAYVDTTLVLVQGKPIGKTQQASLSLSYRLDRVDPLFRSVATSTQADIRRQAGGITATLGPVSLQFVHERMQDNLDHIASILQTKTRQSNVNLGINAASLLGARKRAWLVPALTAGYSNTHQFGVELPGNSGFSASHVPDQISRSVQAAVEWQVRQARFGYRWNASRQDNRQPGRERADFNARTGAVFFGFTPTERFDVGLETSADEQESVEAARTDQTRRHGVTLTWRFFKDFALAGNFSRTLARDDPRTSQRNGHEAYLELSSGFRVWRSRAEQQQNSSRLFVRYTERKASAFDRIFATASDTEGYTVTTGINLSVF